MPRCYYVFHADNGKHHYSFFRRDSGLSILLPLETRIEITPHVLVEVQAIKHFLDPDPTMWGSPEAGDIYMFLGDPSRRDPFGEHITITDDYPAFSRHLRNNGWEKLR